VARNLVLLACAGLLAWHPIPYLALDGLAGGPAAGAPAAIDAIPVFFLALAVGGGKGPFDEEVGAIPVGRRVGHTGRGPCLAATGAVPAGAVATGASGMGGGKLGAGPPCDAARSCSAFFSAS